MTQGFSLGDNGAVRFTAVIAVVLGVLWVHENWDEVPSAQPEQVVAAPSPPQLITAFGGVRLGEKLADAAKELGPFDKQKDEPRRAKKYIDEEDHWQRNGRVRVAVRGGVIFSVSYPCTDGRDTSAVNRIACRDGSDRIKSILGDKVRVLCPILKPDHPDAALAPVARAYDAVAFGTRYIVIRDKVTGFIIAEPRELESMVGFNWGKCG